MGWEFALLLLGAMVASTALSLWQHRAYIKVVNEMARENAGRQLRLVSGRAKGRLKGAVVVLLVDPATEQIVQARTMVGATIFSRLRPAPELAGPIATVAERVGEHKHLQRAVESALGMLPGAKPATSALQAPSRGRIRIPRAQSSPS
jgi:DNA-binding transcriptional regulator of glucitol operon